MNRSGIVKKVKWLDEKNDFTVIEMLDAHSNGLFTAVGKMGPQYLGHKLNMVGKEVANPRGTGKNFEVHHYEVHQPDTLEGIYLLLCSGLFEGISSRIARYLVDTYQYDTLSLLKKDINILLSVPGVGVQTFLKIRDSYQDADLRQQAMAKLRNDYKFTFSESLAILKSAPEDAMEILTKSPYSLCRRLSNRLNFVVFDRAIIGHGWSEKDPVRIREVLNHKLRSVSGEGHTLNSYAEILNGALEYLNIDRYLVEHELQFMIEKRWLYVTDANQRHLIQSQWFYSAEKEIANRIRILMEMPAEKQLLFNSNDIRLRKLKASQLNAIKAPYRHKVSIITGGPGTGKTTLLKTLLALMEEQNLTVISVARTGKAAQRMREVTGRDAVTIHRALGPTEQVDEFVFNDINPLKVDVVVVDEMSMLETLIFRTLLRAMPSTARLIMIGDVNQIPSVQPGAVFRDLIASKTIPVYWLTENLRIKKENGQLPTPTRVANGILTGQFLDVPNDDEWSFFPTKKDAETKEKLIELVSELSSMGVTQEEMQVFTPTNKGPLGVERLNSIIKGCIHPNGKSHIELGDKVMQTVNDYTLDISNGDVGKVTSVIDNWEKAKKDSPVLIAKMGSRLIEYTKKDIYNLALAYAISGHKSQGSEYNHAIIVIPDHYFSLMDRFWLYTLITRCKKKAYLIGNENVIKKIVKSRRSHERKTLLKEQMWRFLSITNEVHK